MGVGFRRGVGQNVEGKVIVKWMFVAHVDGVRRCLRTAVTIGPIVHFPGDI
jgi:hypothetical protein